MDHFTVNCYFRPVKLSIVWKIPKILSHKKSNIAVGNNPCIKSNEVERVGNTPENLVALDCYLLVYSTEK